MNERETDQNVAEFWFYYSGLNMAHLIYLSAYI